MRVPSNRAVREIVDQAASDDTERDNQFHIYQQSQNCEAPGCANPGGAFTSECDDRIYEFCSESCRAAFERPAA